MADLTIPARQTYPAIRGYVADEEGALDLTTAEEISLLLDDGTDQYELPATTTDETATINGVDTPMNWTAPIGAGATDSPTSFNAKLKILWDSGTTPEAIQYCPQSGYLTIIIGENVTEAA